MKALLKLVSRLLSVAVVAVLLSGCAGLSKKPEAPKLSVLSVKPIGLNLKSQVFRFNLNAFNPNSFKLPLQKIDFVARFSGIDVGEGSTTDGVTLSPNGDTAFSMDVATDLSKLVTNFGDLFKAKGLNFDYELDGKMRFIDSSLFSGLAVPFKLNGNLLEK